MISAVAFQKSYTVTGRIKLPESDAAGERAAASVLVRHGQSEYAGTVSYGKAAAGKVSVMITRNGASCTPSEVPTKAGWNTVRLLVDRGSNMIRMKIWPDDVNEPDWQVSRTFIAGGTATGVGYRYEGEGSLCADDLCALETVLKSPTEIAKRPASSRK